ncbi:MAG: MerR family transcriptional regulator [Acidimicrobiales bacterium]|jgi:DNA-binding transcriptional MerR regulator
MELRVEQLSAQAAVSVDTIRYYQSKGLLEPPRREGRIAWYGEGHLDRLRRIRSLQKRGFTLATIARLVSGELDAADEALLGQLSGLPAARAGATRSSPPGSAPETAGTAGDADGAPVGDGAAYTVTELSEVTGMPLALLKALEAEGLLIPQRIGGQERYTDEDVAASRAGLLMLEWGIPLSDLLDLARRHHEATVAVAREAVAMFAVHVRDPLRHGAVPDALSHPAPVLAAGTTGDPAVDGLLQSYAELLPAVTTLVGHHFARTLVKAALDHVERVGSDEERRAVLTGSVAPGPGSGLYRAGPDRAVPR